MDGDKPTTMGSEGKQHCHTVTKDVKVTCDGKASKVAKLKAGMPVRVPLHKDDPTVATTVEVGKHISPAPAPPAVEVATAVEVGKHISAPVAGRKE